MTNATSNDILNQSEQLISLLKNISGLIGVANAVQFEALDENSYINFMNVLMNLHEDTIRLSLEIQQYLYRHVSSDPV